MSGISREQASSPFALFSSFGDVWFSRTFSKTKANEYELMKRNDEDTASLMSAENEENGDRKRKGKAVELPGKEAVAGPSGTQPEDMGNDHQGSQENIGNERKKDEKDFWSVDSRKRTKNLYYFALIGTITALLGLGFTVVIMGFVIAAYRQGN
ncbi:hypothetical protein L207DRAFT_589997 [Hyaloscypha variabilis F]|uniref:Transmembrane protein n=1 Tax=Hyaloscypha variabilis (strain UAMH 11265 / GT02V1 / F) TaxID=1149755 RepID=A0A2J6R321_HYAVF|nr:hypothetical protein L207DRAFT_589997 [Hyaloscypha variabilis F]